MGRVHGKIKILRELREGEEKHYSNYLDDLREDFGHICGYCGKSEVVTKNAFEIDHFIPKRLAPEKENDYSNLVYSCYVCNRKKSGKWISEDKAVQFVDGKGFVDPATDDYDQHLMRDEQGNIIGITEAGKYMVEIGFEFDRRPIREIYKAMLLIEKKQQIEKKIKSLSPKEAEKYIGISKSLQELQNMFFDMKE